MGITMLVCVTVRIDICYVYFENSLLVAQCTSSSTHAHYQVYVRPPRMMPA